LTGWGRASTSTATRRARASSDKSALVGMAGTESVWEWARAMAGSLFDEPVIAQPAVPVAASAAVGPAGRVPVKVKEVEGTKVRGGYLAWADYGSNTITIPTFYDVVRKAGDGAKAVYKQAVDAVRRYIMAHEVNELRYQPQDEAAHGRMEADALSGLEASDPEAAIAGYALHKKRLRDGGKWEKEFTQQTSRFYDLKGAFQRYGECLDGWVGLVSDVVAGRPEHQDIIPAYARAGTGKAGRRYVR